MELKTWNEIKTWITDDGWFESPDKNYRIFVGDEAKIGDGATTMALNEHFRQVYVKIGDEHIFDKWVTPDRLSPNFDGGTPLKYQKGAILEVPEAQINDQQCGVGLHVLRKGYRPEWAGLCEANHNLICIQVKVKSEDICFAGLPTMDIKLRVKWLEVLT